ncbi:hypothetical protein Fmac_021298 [Flemingia macrophylla]|uniref:Uncharacterized protein n=1 Tax=Flemingia macrophylla TaxID=520843 RepID=A0ABD1LWJ5_9FABA
MSLPASLLATQQPPSLSSPPPPRVIQMHKAPNPSRNRPPLPPPRRSDHPPTQQQARPSPTTHPHPRDEVAGPRSAIRTTTSLGRVTHLRLPRRRNNSGVTSLLPDSAAAPSRPDAAAAGPHPPDTAAVPPLRPRSDAPTHDAADQPPRRDTNSGSGRRLRVPWRREGRGNDRVARVKRGDILVSNSAKVKLVDCGGASESASGGGDVRGGPGSKGYGHVGCGGGFSLHEGGAHRLRRGV